MSVATAPDEAFFAPLVQIPDRARRCAPPERLASVTALHRPSEHIVAPPLRLTRRGVAVLTAAVAVLATVLTGVAWLSAPSSPAGPSSGAVPDTVSVQSGDSLWAIASRVAPQRDPRAEVADLQRLNHLGTAALVPGEVLRTR
jgi:nucleoid-associated protein YgaU